MLGSGLRSLVDPPLRAGPEVLLRPPVPLDRLGIALGDRLVLRAPGIVLCHTFDPRFGCASQVNSRLLLVKSNAAEFGPPYLSDATLHMDFPDDSRKGPV